MIPKKICGLIGTLLSAAICTTQVAAQDGASPPLLQELFQDHAVLQRERAVPIWGKAAPSDDITVSIGDQTATAHADHAGRWQAMLPPMHAGGPYTLSVRTRSGQAQSLSDILVGDVYLCSGQSNMEFPVANSLNAAREIAAASNDSIRLLSVKHSSNPAPLAHFQDPVAWTAASPATVGQFSAACYYFARELQKHVPVPLGLIHSSWGGSRIEPWMSAGGAHASGADDGRLDLLRQYARDPAQANRRWGAEWEAWWRRHAPAGSQPWKAAAGADWHDVPEPLRDWKTWGVPELANHDGMVWFRRSVTLTAAQAKSAAALSIGAIDEVDETWVNERPIANSFGYGTERTYRVPDGLLHAGENSIVINVLSTWDAGGMYGPAEHMALSFADRGVVSIAGGWQYQTVPENLGNPPRAPWEPVAGLTSIYNAMIAPLAPVALRGVLWYQGESNAGEATLYERQLSGLMRDWRDKFQHDLPFLIVQLPNFGKPYPTPSASTWAELREAQRRVVVNDRNAALAVTIDLGESGELHPPNKQAIGLRLARAARHLIYAGSLSASGPTPRAATRRGDQVVVGFGAIEGRLRTYSAARPTAFELCGATPAGCRFADAAIEADEVILQGADATVSRVRYCWGDAPVCNLYDDSGLPAGPFELAIQ